MDRAGDANKGYAEGKQRYEDGRTDAMSTDSQIFNSLIQNKRTEGRVRVSARD